MDAASIESYEGLIAAIRRRVAELDIRFENIDDVAGLTRGHTQKLLTCTPRKFFGDMSLSAILGALGLRLQLVADDAALARHRHRLVSSYGKRNGPHEAWRSRVLAGSQPPAV